MSEELKQKRLTEHGLKLGNYEYYNIGNTTLKQLKKFKIIPKKDYKKYEARRPDALIVDRRNKTKPKIICVIEHKDDVEFKTDANKKNAIEECNDLCQILNANIGIATDSSSFIWFNPNQKNRNTEYADRTSGTKRSYTIVKDESGNDFVKEFIIDQKNDEPNIMKLEVKTMESIKNLELVRDGISPINSKLIKGNIKDPTSLAKQIWQDVWSVSGATPEKCLYTFVELFIFKYLSDLNILIKDDKGIKVNFRDIFALEPTEAFKNYSHNVRDYLKKMFPPSVDDHTTIINGTVLNPNVPEHSEVFYKILKKFDNFGEMKNIDPSFKSKIFEQFMKESISTKNWGRYFTPRNIVDAMIEISDIDKLEEGSVICDPACGVGGFILEPLKLRDNGVNFYYKIEGNKIKPRYNFHGFDKGFEKEEQLTIILAKANMLIFLSELLKNNSTLPQEFSNLFNSTFKLLTGTILGTLSKTECDKYDLILTNPPYVTSGSSNYKDAIKNDDELSNFYKINGMGVEGLFLEWIIRSLKPDKKAFVIIPNGILDRTNDNKLREFLKNECVIDGLISLPVNSFYTTPQKTYILAITKKSEKSEIQRKEHKQTEPVFTYLASSIGETLDIYRFVTEKNDLVEMVSLFNQFKGAKKSFKSPSLRCKITPIEKFNPDDNWSIDRWWNKEEKVELGIEKEQIFLTVEQFREKVKEVEDNIHKLNEKLDGFT